MARDTFATMGLDLIGSRIDNGRLVLLKVLGVGAYGVVYLAQDTWQPQPTWLAVKCLLRAGLDTRQRHFQMREIGLHQLAGRHPGVVKLHKVMEEDGLIFMIMDYYDEGDLFGMITEKQRYLGNDELIRKVFLQIIDAVAYCHSMGIYHRDLKPENILVMDQGRKVCIADFGLATSEKASTDFGCGSTFYLSPECQGGAFDRVNSYITEYNDLWSLGVILVNLTCGRNPWRQATLSDETFAAFAHNPNFLRTILPISEETDYILQGLFDLQPNERTRIPELRRQILAVKRFTMSEAELQHAHSAARQAAAAARTPAPRRRPSLHVHVAQQQVAADAGQSRPQRKHTADSFSYIESEDQYITSGQCEASWSGSQYDEPDMVMDHSSGDTRSTDIITPTRERHPGQPDTGIQHGSHPDPSRSSSSEEALPPTPPSYPADHPSQHWESAESEKSMHSSPRTDRLHASTPSSIPGFRLR